MEAINHFFANYTSGSLYWITLITAALYLCAIFMLLFFKNNLRHENYYINIKMMNVWFLHAAVYWSFISVVRLFFGYVGPSPFVTIWSGIIYMQAPLTIIIALFPIMKKRRGRNE